MFADVNRIIRLAGGVAWKVGRRARPFDTDDVEQELLCYVYDEDAQRKRGIKVLEAHSDDEISENLRTIANEWLREHVYQPRDVARVWAAGGLAVETAKDELEPLAIEQHEKRLAEIRELYWYDDDPADKQEALALAEAQYAQALKDIRTNKYPSEGHHFVARTLQSKPGEDRDIDARRRMLAHALWSYSRRPGRKDYGRDVLLVCRKYRTGAKLSASDARRVRRAIPDIVSEVNRQLAIRPMRPEDVDGVMRGAGRRDGRRVETWGLMVGGKVRNWEGPGARTSMSNAVGQAILTRQEEEN